MSRRPIRARSRRAGCLLAPLALVWLSGCAAGGLADELTGRPNARAIGKADGKVVRIPSDEKLSITASPAQKAPGLAGSAAANAAARPEGSAEAAANVDGGGTASAAFQLGHAFSNDSDRQLDLRIALKFACEHSADSGPDDLSPNAAVSLKLLAREGRGRLRQQVVVFDHALDAGKIRSKRIEELEMDVTLGPGTSINVYLAGAVVVENREGQSAAGTLKVSGVEMTVTPTVAPAVRTATQPVKP